MYFIRDVIWFSFLIFFLSLSSYLPLFELFSLLGYAPFTASTIQEIFFQIQNHKIYLQRPDEESESAPVSNEAWDLITKLLAPYETRFGSLIEIKEHPFFADVDWDNIRECQVLFLFIIFSFLFFF